MNKVFILAIVFSVFSCSSERTTSLKKELSHKEINFAYTDKNGEYISKVSSGFTKKNNQFVTKRSLEIPNKGQEGVLEKSISYSLVGTLKKKQTLLRPYQSQYNVWFDGKKYTTDLKINSAKRTIEIKTSGPESNSNINKEVKFPNTKAYYCFFSQIIECAKAVGYIKKSSKFEGGTMKFYVIWEGYPFLNQTYSDIPSEVFSKAELEFDGKTKQNERRFNLKISGQSIFYILDENDLLKKMFWVSQGISVINKNVKNIEEEQVE